MNARDPNPPLSAQGADALAAFGADIAALHAVADTVAVTYDTPVPDSVATST